MNQYVALLRGINVGGNNLIKMLELKACFEQQGFSDVATYIQSGNVLFATKSSDVAGLTKKIEKALSTAFGYTARVVVRSRQQMTRIVEHAPKGFGSQPSNYRYDVIFIKEPLTAAAAIKDISLKEGVDQAWASNDVLYFSRLESRVTQSRINRIVGTPMYQNMTIRNWNTTKKLLQLMQT